MGTGATNMSTTQQPEALRDARWYMVNKMGMATLCASKADAEKEAADAQRFWPHMGPHRAVQLVEAASVAASAGSEPVAPAGAAVLCWVNEDELPEGLTQEAYSALFPHSKVDGVRMFPIFGPTAQAAPAGAGAWANLKLMMEESAWDGTLQLSDALANIDDLAAAHPSPPEGMVGGWMPIETAPKDGKLILVNFKIKGVRAVSWDSPFHDEVTEENGIWCVDDDKHGPYGLRGYNDDGPTAPTHWMPLPLPPTTSAGSGKGGES